MKTCQVPSLWRGATRVAAGLAWLLLVGCSASGPIDPASGDQQPTHYLIGPGDTVNVFVWRNPEVSVTGIPIRPDGKISTPLVEDMQAAGKSPSELARDIEKALGKYIKEPLVTVTVTGFVGEYGDQVRVVGAAALPAALPYREGMTLLDLMIAVGGLTEFADGNDAVLVRHDGSAAAERKVRLDDLMRRGKIQENIPLRPGDILIIPEAWF